MIYARSFSKTLSGSLRVGFVACAQHMADELADIKMLTSIMLAENSRREGIMLAPGAVFRPHLERSPWMRFNVSVCEDMRAQRWLQRQVATRAAALTTAPTSASR